MGREKVAAADDERSSHALVAPLENFFQETLQPTLDPTADIPDNLDAVAARYATAAPRYGIQFLTE